MLKSYRLFKKRKKKRKRGRGLSDVGNLAVGGVTAVLGVGLLSQTANAVSRV